MINEKRYNLTIKHSQLRELQRTLLYHIDTILIPYAEEKAKQSDYAPKEIVDRVECLKSILKTLNVTAGDFREDYKL